MQQIIVIIIVILAFFLLIKRIVRVIRSKDNPCTHCSSSCNCHRFCDAETDKMKKNVVKKQKKARKD